MKTDNDMVEMARFYTRPVGFEPSLGGLGEALSHLSGRPLAFDPLARVVFEVIL
jgi:hypothetical protein